MNHDPELIYLACPYNHKDPDVRERRFRTVSMVAGALMQHGGHKIFSSISHTHPIAIHGMLPLGFEFWQEYDKAILRCCKAIFVLCLEGWMDSVGVKAEVEYAKQLNLEIKYLYITYSDDPDSDDSMELEFMNPYPEIGLQDSYIEGL